jgi:hypothetical protein
VATLAHPPQSGTIKYPYPWVGLHFIRLYLVETAVVMPVPSNILPFVRKGKGNISCTDLPIRCVHFLIYNDDLRPGFSSS